MTGGLLLAAALALPSPPTPVPLDPHVVLARYAAALKRVTQPPNLTFDYTRDQRGPRTQVQMHRVFRHGAQERDETLSVDGHTLVPPRVTIFRSHPNRYAVAALAPRPPAYAFAFAGSVHVAHHLDYRFTVRPRTHGRFAITAVTIDGVHFLPTQIDFAMTRPSAAGSVTFGTDGTWWLPFTADAHADVGSGVQTERLSFYTYRFPPSLPPSTFLRAIKPASKAAVVAP